MATTQTLRPTCDLCNEPPRSELIESRYGACCEPCWADVRAEARSFNPTTGWDPAPRAISAEADEGGSCLRSTPGCCIAHAADDGPCEGF